VLLLVKTGEEPKKKRRRSVISNGNQTEATKLDERSEMFIVLLGWSISG